VIKGSRQSARVLLVVSRELLGSCGSFLGCCVLNSSNVKEPRYHQFVFVVCRDHSQHHSPSIPVHTGTHTHTERDKHSHTDTSGHERCSKRDRFLGEISIRLMPLLHPTVLWHTQSCNSQDIFPCPWERPDTTTHTHTHTGSKIQILILPGWKQKVFWLPLIE